MSSVSIDSIELVRRDIYASQRFSLANVDLQMRVVRESCGPQLEATLRAYVFANPLVDVKIDHPKTWWDGFKVEYFPSFLLKRYPAKITHYEIKADELATQLCVPKNYGPVNHMVIHKSTRLEQL